MVSDQPDLKVTAIKTVSKYTTQQQESANTHTVNATDTHKIDNTRNERKTCTKQSTETQHITVYTMYATQPHGHCWRRRMSRRKCPSNNSPPNGHADSNWRMRARTDEFRTMDATMHTQRMTMAAVPQSVSDVATNYRRRQLAFRGRRQLG